MQDRANAVERFNLDKVRELKKTMENAMGKNRTTLKHHEEPKL